MKKPALAAPTSAVAITSPTDRGDGIASVIAADGDTPAADTESADRSDAGEAREGETVAPAVAVTTAASLDVSGPADIAPATEFEPSGAPMQTSDFDLDHVALDANPRANTTVDQNRIDFNDPVRTGEQIVTDALKAS